MATQVKTSTRETMRDFAIVSSFGFWAVMLGFVPVATIPYLAS